MILGAKEKTGEDLRKEAIKLGVSLEASGNEDGTFREGAIQARVRDAKNLRLAQRTWIIALISAISAVLSALSAWFAILK